MSTITSTNRSVFPTDIVGLLQLQQIALQKIDAGAAVEEVLAEFALSCEKYAHATAYVSILVDDPVEARLRHFAAPSLPAAYRDAVENVDGPVAPRVQGPQARSQEPRYSTDIASERRWPEWQALALSNGISACWSWPFRGSFSQRDGVLACHFTKPTVPSADDTGMLALMAQTAALVLDRQASAHSIKTTEDRHRQIFNSATDFAIIGTDLQGRVTDWNEGAHRILGWTEGEALGMPLHSIFTPEDVARRRPEAEMVSSLANGFSPDERWHLRKSGERFWAMGQMTPLKRDGGDVVGFVKVLRDRTDQKRDETQRQALTNTLQAEVAERTHERDRIWQNSLDLLLAIGSDGIVQAVNPAWTTSLGYDADELVGNISSRSYILTISRRPLMRLGAPAKGRFIILRCVCGTRTVHFTGSPGARPRTGDSCMPTAATSPSKNDRLHSLTRLTRPDCNSPSTQPKWAYGS